MIRKAVKFAFYAAAFGMSPRTINARLQDILQLPTQAEISRWEDDGGAV